jgi:hypothetical protein
VAHAEINRASAIKISFFTVQLLLKILGEEIVAFYQGMGKRPRRNMPARLCGGLGGV